MKRVLFCRQNVGAKGGLEKYGDRILRGFLDKGCDVTLLTSKTHAHPITDPHPHFHHVSIPISGLFGFQKLKHWDSATKKFAEQGLYDRVFTLDRITHATHIRAGNGVHKTYLRRRDAGKLRRSLFQINPLHRTILRLEEGGFRSPKLKKIIANSHMVKAEIMAHYGIDEEKIAVHHNGVEYQELQPCFTQWPTNRAALFRELNITPHLYTFLFVGHHYRRKGLDLLLEGFARIRDAQLLVVGRDRHPKHYQALAERLALFKRVHFLGVRDDMKRLYAAADALVIPSLYDPFANVTVEAVAMGLFVVTSAYNGGKEILNPHTGAIIEQLFDPESVADALKMAIKHPKTPEHAEMIRAQAAPLDFHHTLPPLIETCLNDSFTQAS
jgi:UDP-glucose:(heptosyl)LPS alpha-1,3-glucosyltransferase